MRILIAENGSPIASYIAKGLAAEQYAVDVASNAEEAQQRASGGEYDLLILDVNSPGADGFRVLRNVKEAKPSLPVILVSATERVENAMRGLEMGADDYLMKPFSVNELCARVRAVLGRAQRQSTTLLRVANLELDRVQRAVQRAGRKIDLTPREYGLLEYLMRNAGHGVTRAMITRNVWNLNFDTKTNLVDVYINYVRKKIDTGHDQKLIRTIRGVGYMIGAPDA